MKSKLSPHAPLDTAASLATPIPSHSLSTSRIMLGLMALSQRAEQDALSGRPETMLGGVISKKILRSLLAALHIRDVNTVHHSRRVALLATSLARYLGWEGRQLRALEVAALLHDIGKIGVPDSILFKPGRLNADEVELLSLHFQIGIDVLQACRVDHEVLDIISQSHVRFGSVNNVASLAETHLGSRILAIADAYASLSIKQVFRESLSEDDIHETLMKNAGTLYDGNLACAMKRWLATDRVRIEDLGRNSQPTQGPQSPAEIAEAQNLCHIFSYLYILESLYDGFFLVDSDLRFMVWNRAAEDLLGKSPRNILGRNWTSSLIGYCDQNGEPLSEENTPLQQVIQSGQPKTGMVYFRKTNRDATPVELQSIPLIDSQGQIRGFAEILRNLNRSDSHRPNEYRELKMAASRDSLTKLANRGTLETALAHQIYEYTKTQSPAPFSVMFLDVDLFKNVNDTHGHAAGDQVLIGVAKLLQQETYSGEIVARYGGEEFVILCPDTDLHDVYRRAERLRNAIKNSRFTEIANLAVTASFGVAEMQSGDSVESLLQRADKGLYRAKNTGRDRTCGLKGSELSTEEINSQSQGLQPESAVFRYQTQFTTVTNKEMIIYKFKGFLSEADTRLTKVSNELIEMQVGSIPLLRFWGNRPSKQPVKLHVKLSRRRNDPTRSNGNSVPVVLLDVTVTPLGWCGNQQAFQSRAVHVARALRSHFAAIATDPV